MAIHFIFSDKSLLFIYHIQGVYFDKKRKRKDVCKYKMAAMSQNHAQCTVSSDLYVNPCKGKKTK